MIWLLGIGKWLSGAFSSLLGAIGRNPWPSAVIALLCLSGWLLHGKNGALAERDQARHQITLEIASHRQTKAAYRAAQAQAQQLETARLVRVTQQQQRITANVSSDYASKLADLRARYDRMRRDDQARAIAYGSSGSVAVPALPQGASGTDGASDPQGLSLAERFLASQQAEQLDALITWVAQQSGVPVN